EQALEKRQADLRSREEQMRQRADALDGEVAKRLAGKVQELEVKARKAAEDGLAVRMKDLEAQVAEKASALKTAQEQELALRREQRRLKEEREAFEIEMTRKLDAERDA